MRTTKSVLKIVLGIALLFPGVNVAAAVNADDVPVKTTVVIKSDSIHMDTLNRAKKSNPADMIFEVLPEVFTSFGYTEKKFDASIKLMSQTLAKKISVMNKFADKKELKPNSKQVKQLLRDLNLRIGGSHFETRELKPDFVSKCTPNNVRSIAVMLNSMKQNYDSALQQKTLRAKFGVFKNFQKNPEALQKSELIKAFVKEYGDWITELMPGSKGAFMPIPGNTTTDSVRIAKRKLEKEAKKQRDQKIYDGAYTLSPEQVKVSALPYKEGSNCQLVKIERGAKETKVTIAIAIHFDWNWISTDSVFCLIDKQTQDRYYPRSMESGIPLNRVIVVKNNAKKMIEVTYVYPPLKKNVLVVDILDFPASTLEIPSNTGEPFEFRNIFVDDYSGQILKGNVYR